MARTAPFPNIPAIPGMNPGVFVMGGGGNGGGSGRGNGRGRGTGQGGSGSGGGHGAAGDGKSAPDPQRYPECGTAAHPVDVVTGRAFTHPIEDITLNGPLLLSWHRVYSSAMCMRDAGLGWGWGHSMGWMVEVQRRRVLVWNDHGVCLEFPAIGVGEEVIGLFGWVLRCEPQGYVVDAGDDVLRRFAELSGDGLHWKLTSIEDRNANRITLEYEQGLLCQVTDSAGRVLRVDVTARGQIERVRVWLTSYQAGSGGIDGSDRSSQWQTLVRYRYDAEGCLIEVTDADGYVWRYAYGEDHRLIRDTDRAGLTFEFVYDNEGRCVESWGHDTESPHASLADGLPATLADGTPAKGIHHAKLHYYPDGYTEVADSLEVRRFFGNAHGLLDKAVSGGAVLTCSYNERGFLLSRTGEEGAITTFEHDARGRVLKETDPLGRVIVTERDAAGRAVAVIDPAGGVTKILRDGRGNEIAITDPEGATTHYAYDGRGLVREMVSPTGGKYRFDHDAHGNRTAVSLPNGAIQRWTYDALGRCLSEIRLTGEATRFVWSLRGDLLSVSRPDGGVTKYEHDGERHVTRIVDPEGRETRLGWGGYHRIVYRRAGDSGAIDLRYDREGNLVCVQNERHEHHLYAHDSTGLVIAEKTFDGRVIRYRYDQAGRLVRIDQGTGGVVEMAYNAAGELSKRVGGDSEQIFEYDLRGDIVRAASGSDEVTFQRDACGRVIGEIQIVDGVACSVRLRRDPSGIVIGRSTSRGHTLTIERDGVGQRRRTLLNNVSAIDHEADLAGRESVRRLPHGGRVELAYSAHGRLASQRVVAAGYGRPQAPAGSLAGGPSEGGRRGPEVPSWLGREPGLTVERLYRYDRSAELLEVIEPFGVAVAYSYDGATRLLEVRGPAGPQEQFSYDPAGNLHEVLPGAPRRQYGPGGRLRSRGEAEYTWDEAGRLYEKRLAPEHAYRYTWTDDGMLSSVRCPDGRTVEMRYDSFGRRMVKRVYAPAEPPGARRRGVLLEETRFVWDGDSLVHEIKTRAMESGDPIVEERTYGFADDGFVPLFQVNVALGAAPGVFHCLADPAGCPEQLVDGAGRVVCSLERTAWGAAAPRPGAATSTPLRFQGQYADEETGLFYNRFRYYDPVIGLYLSPDPLGLEGGVSCYGYGWNPTHWIDPLGLATHTPNSGVIYLRRNANTGRDYVGKSKSKEAYGQRRRDHQRALQKRCPGATAYGFFELEQGIGAAPALAQAEEDWIRAGGGPGGTPGQTGPLENKIHGQADGKYKGKVPKP